MMSVYHYILVDDIFYVLCLFYCFTFYYGTYIVELSHEKAFTANLLLLKPMYDVILDMAFIFYDALLQMLSMCD